MAAATCFNAAPVPLESLAAAAAYLASAAHRTGFHTLVAQVTLEQVGLILSYDVTRLSRNCSDWYPLLDLCGYKGGLIGDGDGMYDPATVNGRLLLGLKGTLSEWERHTMKARLTAGLIHKAMRGELALTLPTGLIRTSQGTVQKIPNQEAQARLSLVFETFLQCRSASKVVEVFNTHDLLLPRRARFGDLVWKAPRVAAVLAILKHPAYAGAFTYGRTQGDNFLTITTSGGEMISSVTTDSASGFQDLKQPRISGISGVKIVPEPSS